MRKSFNLTLTLAYFVTPTSSYYIIAGATGQFLDASQWRNVMDCFHRQPMFDTRTNRNCAFCQQVDPDFSRRNLLDQLVKDSDTAGGHITEEGYLRHRIAELRILKLRADLALWKGARQVA